MTAFSDCVTSCSRMATRVFANRVLHLERTADFLSLLQRATLTRLPLMNTFYTYRAVQLLPGFRLVQPHLTVCFRSSCRGRHDLPCRVYKRKATLRRKPIHYDNFPALLELSIPHQTSPNFTTIGCYEPALQNEVHYFDARCPVRLFWHSS